MEIHLAEEFNYFQGFILPTLTSIFGAFLYYLIQKYYIVLGRLSFWGYPKISGKYKAVYPDDRTQLPEIISVKQFGGRISGSIHDPNNNSTVQFMGNVTKTRLAIYQFNPKNKLINDYGVGMILFGKYLKNASGIVIYIDSEKQEIVQVKVEITPV